MKVLISGGCGFLGGNIAAKFLSMGEKVVIIDALYRHGSEKNLEWLLSLAKPGQLTFHKVDTANNEAIEAIFRKDAPFDYVCHLAGQVAMTTSLSDPRRDLMTNVVGSFNVLEAARKFSPETFVAFSSTNKVYGDLHDIEYGETDTRYTVPKYPKGFDESLRLDFASPYGCSKGAADQYVRDWYRNYGLKTVVFRHSSIFGGRQFSTYDQGWVGWFCQKALEQKRQMTSGSEIIPFSISGTGKQVRDVLHADDLVDLYLSAFAHRQNIAGEVFNIGGGAENSLSLLELFAMLEDLVNGSSEEKKIRLLYSRLERRKSDQDFFVADISKAQRLLEWTPKVDSRSGVLKMLEWCQRIAS